MSALLTMEYIERARPVYYSQEDLSTLMVWVRFWVRFWVSQQSEKFLLAQSEKFLLTAGKITGWKRKLYC